MLRAIVQFQKSSGGNTERVACGNSCPCREDDSGAEGDDASGSGARTELSTQSQPLQHVHICNTKQKTP